MVLAEGADGVGIGFKDVARSWHAVHVSLVLHGCSFLRGLGAEGPWQTRQSESFSIECKMGLASSGFADTFSFSLGAAWWQLPQASLVDQGWVDLKGFAAFGAWHTRQSSRPSMGWGVAGARGLVMSFS